MSDQNLSTRLYKQDDDGFASDVFADLDQAFDCTNKTFFEGRLNAPVFSFTRNRRSHGAVLPDRYVSEDGRTAHGIAINSDHCQAVGVEGSLTLLAFLTVQLARRELGPVGKNGKRGTPGYIDSWSLHVLARMALEPFVDGSDDPRKLGYGLSARPIDGGHFDIMCRELLVAGFRIRWHEASDFDPGPNDGDAAGTEPAPKKQTRTCFECPSCGLKALAKPTALLNCGQCHVPMPPAMGQAS